MTHPPAEGWRVFPWDPDADEGEPFSASSVPASQGQGRFDLPAAPGGVLYVAETPAHAAAEMIQHYRGHRLEDSELRAGGYRLALARVTISASLGSRLVDLCDPAVLVALGLPPDETASANRRTTQAIAARIHAAGHAGLRWWSALTGDWHTVVLFRDRLEGGLAFETPEPLPLEHAALREAMRALGMKAE